MINSYTTEWEDKVRTEKEREAELENLRHTVSTQAARLRLLEERSEASDKEHVQLASELVHAKVENEELRDLNDALNLQVEQLKNVVDKQPGEVEEKLRTEMDRIMKRNIEVQNENRAMEDSMAEMEKELVATKMKWAEVCSCLSLGFSLAFL
jgi:predicted  nucleic acid-binding Zn-ribbon protein